MLRENSPQSDDLSKLVLTAGAHPHDVAARSQALPEENTPGLDDLALPPAVDPDIKGTAAEAVLEEVLFGPETADVAYGLKQIDPRDIDTYPALRGALERISEIAAHIREDTGLKLNLSRVTFDVCPADEFAKRVITEALVRVGRSRDDIAKEFLESHPDYRGNMKLLKQMGDTAAGVLMPTEEAILLNGGILKKANANGLGDILYHELIHAAQRQTYPKFFEFMDQFGRQANDLGAKGLKDTPEYLHAIDNANACLRLIEGMPTALQMKHKKEYFPGASDGLGLFEKLWHTGRALFTRDGWREMSKYIGGAIDYNKMQASSPHLDHLAYEIPGLALLAFKKQPGTVVIELPAGTSLERAREVGELAFKFLSFNSNSNLSAEIKVREEVRDSA